MAYTKTIWENSPSENTPLSAENLNNIENGIEDVDARLTTVEAKQGTLTATAGSNGDFKLDLEITLYTGMIITVLFPTATTGSSNARLSIDNGTTYKNIKDFNSNQLLASQTQNLYLVLRYNGTDFITDLIDVKIGGNVIATNEFVDGKRVYCKKLNTGAVPNNGNTVTPTGLTNINIIRTGWFIYDGTSSTVIQLPYGNPLATVWSFFSNANTSCNANVATNHGNLTGWGSYLIMWFTYN